MEYLPEAKSARLLTIYSRLVGGETLSRTELARDYNVSTRSIQRDVEALRCFIAEQGLAQEIVYGKKFGGYRLMFSEPRGLTNDEILAVCKILLESRSLRRDEMMPILDKLIDCAVPEDSKKAVKKLIGNEAHHYIEPHHGKRILRSLWQIGQGHSGRGCATGAVQIQIPHDRGRSAQNLRRGNRHGSADDGRHSRGAAGGDADGAAHGAAAERRPGHCI